MKPAPPPPLRIQRFDLIAATLSRLRLGLQRGEFGAQLPAERPLSVALGVSRPTLRAALAALESEGLVRKQGPRGERAVQALSRGRRLAPPRVRLLQGGTPACYLGENLRWVAFLTEQMLARQGQFTVETRPACFSGRPARALERLLADRPADLWILHLSNEPMQQWFAARRIPCLVLGSAWESADLPCIDTDYAAACRHAAGQFLARGHRTLAVLHPHPLRRGDQTSIAAFQAGVAAATAPNVTLHQQPHDGTRAGLLSAIQALLRRKPRPDGWLIPGSETYSSVASALGQRNVRAGRDISLICRNADPLFAALIPTVAHYERDARQMQRHLARCLKALLEHRPLPRRKLLVQSVYRDGHSLRPAPRARAYERT
ncbi:MAG: substrate-binding domain-containing protein [Candidatus Marinimicrobia bacterium]|nr:substrate-binding domain-containing protein [Candidatus Neomarinimicrobiota bacterium]